MEPKDMQQQVSVSRTVHFVDPFTGEHRAAIVTVVDPWAEAGPVCVGLAVFHPESLQFIKHIPYSFKHEVGTWHWPERV